MSAWKGREDGHASTRLIPRLQLNGGRTEGETGREKDKMQGRAETRIAERVRDGRTGLRTLAAGIGRNGRATHSSMAAAGESGDAQTRNGETAEMRRNRTECFSDMEGVRRRWRVVGQVHRGRDRSISEIERKAETHSFSRPRLPTRAVPRLNRQGPRAKAQGPRCTVSAKFLSDAEPFLGIQNGDRQDEFAFKKIRRSSQEQDESRDEHRGKTEEVLGNGRDNQQQWFLRFIGIYPPGTHL
ncbi:hypothetical protein K438DRAFT_2169548 [Mycena galopus ATCC 62051]|nr:hypothetical protein K438DRAFT_2169548 [Mycena galopus ATCC 62051]